LEYIMNKVRPVCGNFYFRTLCWLNMSKVKPVHGNFLFIICLMWPSEGQWIEILQTVHNTYFLWTFLLVFSWHAENKTVICVPKLPYKQ
jgi:hypothetical protein